MNVLELFSGACGAWSLGLERAGMRIVGACEIDPWRRATYGINFPGARLYDDARSLTAERLRADGIPPIDVLAASFPCQDASSANWYGLGIDGDRTGLVSEWLRLLRELRPAWGLAENVRRLVNRGADRIVGDLDAIGYACWPLVMGAEDFGADHERKRLFFVCADADQVRQPRVPFDGEMARVVGPHPWAEPWSASAPRFHGVADGVSARLANEARAAYGDSFPPVIAEAIGRAIMNVQKRDCPKCHEGHMAYQPIASSSAYVCTECGWMEFIHPPWPDRAVASGGEPGASPASQSSSESERTQSKAPE